MEYTTNHYFLGIDGGGTKTVFKLVDENGIAIREIRKGAVNPNDIGMASMAKAFGAAVKEALKLK